MCGSDYEIQSNSESLTHTWSFFICKLEDEGWIWNLRRKCKHMKLFWITVIWGEGGAPDASGDLSNPPPPAIVLPFHLSLRCCSTPAFGSHSQLAFSLQLEHLSVASDTSPKHRMGRLEPKASRNGERHLLSGTQSWRKHVIWKCVSFLVSFLSTSHWANYRWHLPLEQPHPRPFSN